MVGSMPASISVCMIVRDEQHQLQACLEFLRPFVQEIVIVDTGSTDGTLDVARRFTDVVETFTACNDSHGRMLRFDLARNRSFSLATQPWVMWVDADDKVVGAENLELLIKRYDAERRGGPAMIAMPYEYSHDAQGRVELLLERERLVTPKEHFEWHGWVHEVLLPKGADMRRSTGAMKVVHRRSASRKKSESGRNLRILEAQYAVMGDADARHLYYLGQELGYANRIDEAIGFLSKHIDRSGWDDERYMSAQLIAKHYENRGEYEKAIEWAMKAILINENWCEAYFTVARCTYYIAQRTDSVRWWQRAAHFAKIGLDKPRTMTPLFVNPLERDFEIHKYLNMALSKIGDTKGALASVQKGLSVRPDDGHLLFNKRVYEEYEATEDFKRSIDRLVAVGKITREVRDHLQTAAEKNEIANHVEKHKGAANGAALSVIIPVVSRKVFSPFDRDHLDVVFYVGYSVEGWNPDTFKESGLGGSETAVVEMGKRLSRLGHRVRVFGDCVPHGGGPSLEGTFDGVEYLHYDKFKNVSCDVFVSSRRPEAIDGQGLEMRRAILWVHDIHCGDWLTPERAEKFDLIWTLSEWHRGFFVSKYPFLQTPGGKVKVTRNGIDLRRFDRIVQRDSHRAIYSSSPDRGLQVALETWPEIRVRVPDAELHVFYGFNNWEPFADEAQKKLIAHLKKLLAETEGVLFHGRTPQQRLGEEFLKSGVWAYPTWFHETSCITAMEAQAAGLRIVTSPIGALNETVGSRGILIPGNWLSASYKEKFVSAVVEVMLKEGDEDRLALQHYARERFGWDSLAKEWEHKFLELLGSEEIKAGPDLLAYQEFGSEETEAGPDLPAYQEFVS
jgi:glycosyltransferase involved in cell wall biosynthesis